MHFPINIHIGSLQIESHLVFEILAYTIGFNYYSYLRKKTTDLISDSDRIWIFIGAAGGALILSRLLSSMEDFNKFINPNTQLSYYFFNKTILGGLLGGLIGVELTKKILKVKTSSGDLMAFPLILGIMIGRIGCFLAGLEDGTYGTETSLPWGIDFGDGIRRHPTNLYEILFLAFLGTFLSLIEKKFSLKNGVRFQIFLALYCLFRFFVEFIKPFYTFSFGLSPLQIAALMGMIYYYKIFLFPNTLVEKKEKIDAI